MKQEKKHQDNIYHFRSGVWSADYAYFTGTRNGAAPKDVQELLGHADVSTTMNIYAHATREAYFRKTAG